jgi:small-conductance mechanosensitive channel
MSSSVFIEYLGEWLPTGLTFLFVILFLVLAHKLLEKFSSSGSGFQFRNQAILLGLSLVGLLLLIFTLPIQDASRGQILGFFGVVLSAALALSSTTLLGNILAGLMLRTVKNFRPGDFVQVGDSFGRVTELGLFHVEIQTPFRDLTTLPHLYLVKQPVNVIRSSGTFVSADVSLGYDVHHSRVRELLKAAAADCGLADSYVHIVDLGDFSVTYRVAGLLAEVKSLLTTRSLLREKMLDYLHGADVEIVSPSYMNQRQIAPESRTMPAPVPATKEEAAASSEAIVFDKAEEAESIERLRERLEDLEKERRELKKRLSESTDDLEKEKIGRDLETRDRIRNTLSERIEKLSGERKNKRD